MIKIIEENQPSDECKKAFGKIAAKSLLRRYGKDYCIQLVKAYYDNKEELEKYWNEKREEN